MKYHEPADGRPLPAAAPLSVEDIFDRAAKDYEQVGLRADEQSAVRAFFPPAPARVLVAGCGAGRTAIPLALMGYDVVGIDISEQMIRLANDQAEKAGARCAFRRMDMADVAGQFAAGSFDVVFSPFHSLDHLSPASTRLGTVRALAGLLAKKGVLVYSSHNRLFPRVFRHWLRSHEGSYTRIPSREGDLWLHTCLRWSEAAALRPLFRTVRSLPRYALIPTREGMPWKERLARRLAPLTDKSMYFFAQDPRGTDDPGEQG